MLSAYLAVIPRAALDRALLLDLARALAAGAATVALFRALPPLAPWLAMPGAVVMFGLLGLAVGFMSPRDLPRLGDVVLRRPVAAPPTEALP
jgi:hypothetical protein